VTFRKLHAAISSPSNWILLGLEGRYMMRLRMILGLSATAAVFFSLMPASAAQADTSSCGTSNLSQPFLPWGDLSSYGLLPNGGFEQQARAWSLDGQASVVSGNEPFYVNGDNDNRALNLGESGSATSDPVCVDLASPTLRFFAQNSGSPLSTLAVSVQVPGLLGGSTTVPVGVVSAGSDWQPTAQIPIVVNLLNLPVLSDGSSNVAFQFTTLGSGGDWTIDDVYLDPFKTH
jgi:hypothetical protein